jgi:hypothetical protein
VRPGSTLGTFDITDVCPTALHLLDAGVPDDLDGRVRVEFFEPTSDPASRAVRFVRPSGAIATATEDEFDDEAIKDQLRGLGYMN